MSINFMPWRRHALIIRWRNMVGILCVTLLLSTVAVSSLNRWLDARIAHKKNVLAISASTLESMKKHKLFARSNDSLLVLKKLRALYWQQHTLLMRLLSVLTAVPAAVAITQMHAASGVGSFSGVTRVLPDFWRMYQQLGQLYHLSLKQLSYSDNTYHFQVQLQGRL